MALVAEFQTRDAFVDLIADMLFGQTSAGAEAAIVAKHATTDGDGAIDIGTGKSRINADPLDTVPKNPFQVVVVGKIPVPVRSPIEFLVFILAGFG